MQRQVEAQTSRQLGIALQDQFRPQLAQKYFLRARTLDPGSWEVHYHLGTLYYMTGQDSKGRRSLLTAVHLAPEKSELYFAYSILQPSKAGFKLLNKQMLANVHRLLKRHNSSDMDRGYLHFSLFHHFEQAREFDKAFEQLQIGNSFVHKVATDFPFDLAITTTILPFFSPSTFAM